eukprot:1981368-Pyramimonas_sp.AAC.1
MLTSSPRSCIALARVAVGRWSAWDSFDDFPQSAQWKLSPLITSGRQSPASPLAISLTSAHPRCGS